MTPRLFHVSDGGPIDAVEPRPSPPGTAHEGRPLVWAVDEAHLSQHLLPRDCPRVCWGEAGRRVVCVEQAWADRLDGAVLRVHRLDPAGFRLLDATAGHWTSDQRAEVVEVREVADCRAAIAARGDELRLVPDLWPLVDRLVAEAGDPTCIHLRDARPRVAREPAPQQICTERLLLRRWRADDREPFAALNADPEVMRHFPGLLTREQSDDMVDRIAVRFEEHGFGLWAVEAPGVGFVGFTGLWWAAFDAPFTPAMEVGWRLARTAWGRGYAPEAARAAVADGFARMDLPEIVSFTATVNHPSRRVMEKLGMSRDPAEDFDHPSLPPGSPLRRHVLHRLPRPVEE